MNALGAANVDHARPLTLPSIEWFEIAGRLLIAAGLGSALGLEREYDGQDAGFRTHLLVVVGSSLFAVISVAGFDAYESNRGSTNVTIDVTRIAAYVAPGIGFLGGGAILKYGGKVTGLTTAASLWTAAAIGVATGLGLWQPALVATVICLVALVLLQPLGHMAARLGERRRSGIVITVEAGADVAALLTVVRRTCAQRIRQLTYGIGPTDTGEVEIQFWRKPSDEEESALLDGLAEVDGVVGVSTNG